VLQPDPKFVLVVDDDAAVLALTSSVLTAHGYSVIKALGGINALEQSRGREGEIILLLTDVVMPRFERAAHGGTASGQESRHACSLHVRLGAAAGDFA
jgi:CheY-like chemotaxis protein